MPTRRGEDKSPITLKSRIGASTVSHETSSTGSSSATRLTTTISTSTPMDTIATTSSTQASTNSNTISQQLNPSSSESNLMSLHSTPTPTPTPTLITNPIFPVSAPYTSLFSSQMDIPTLRLVSSSQTPLPTSAEASHSPTSKSKKWIIAPALLIPAFALGILFLILYIRRRNRIRKRTSRMMVQQHATKPKGVECPTTWMKEGVMVSVSMDVHVDHDEDEMEHTPMFRDVSYTPGTTSESGS